MQGKLFLCEKHDQAKALAAVLGITKPNNGFYECGAHKVTWCVGHILKLAEPHEYGDEFKRFNNINVLPILPQSYKHTVAIDKKTKKPIQQFFVIKKLLGEAKHVVIATDPDREGELIGWELLDYCSYKGQIERLWATALDKKTLTTALHDIKPGSHTKNLYLAGTARACSDWLVGMNGTRIFTVIHGHLFEPSKNSEGKPNSRLISIGRVQCPTLAMIVKRDLSIKNFKKKTFYKLAAQFAHPNGLIPAQFIMPTKMTDDEGYCVDRTKLEQVLSAIKNQKASITGVEQERVKKAAPLPYDLPSLQTEVSDKLNISVGEVLEIAQDLYIKHKITTYPRAECRYLPESQLDEVEQVVAACVAMDPSLNTAVQQLNLKHKGKVWNTKKTGSSSHHAIIPTMETVDLKGLNAKERAVYEMIRNRYLMQFAPDMEIDETTIYIECEGHQFVANGNAVRFWGWKRLFEQAQEAEINDTSEEESEDAIKLLSSLPAVNQGDSVTEQGSICTEGVTKSLPFYTEGTLLKAMKTIASTIADPGLRSALSGSSGLGTPATRAEVIKTLFERKYISRSGKKVKSTAFGQFVCDIVPDALKSPETTAVWELALSQIANGKMTLEAFMKMQEDFVTRIVNECRALRE